MCKIAQREETTVEEWIDTGDGYRTKTIKRGNCTIEIRRPVLPEKERIKRERVVEIALSSYGRSLASKAST